MRRGRGGPPPDDLAAFYADQYDRVWGALALFTGDRRLAEELAQEAFVKTCQHWETVRAMDAPGAWVHRVGINLAISRARRRRTELRVVQREGARRADGRRRGRRPARRRGGPGRGGRAARRRAGRVVLRFHADLSVAQTAAALGMPEGTVKTRTRRALGAAAPGRAETRRRPGRGGGGASTMSDDDLRAAPRPGRGPARRPARARRPVEHGPGRRRSRPGARPVLRPWSSWSRWPVGAAALAAERRARPGDGGTDDGGRRTDGGPPRPRPSPTIC